MANLDPLEKPSYDSVISWYINSIDDLRKDHYFYQETGIKNDVFMVDFSELFHYMFYSPTSRVDTSLIRYIFKLNPRERDFKFTLFPPAIVELRRHYDFLRNISKKYDYLKNVTDSDNFKKLMKKIKKIREIDKIETNSEDCQIVLGNWKNIINEFKDFDIISLMATEYGANNIISKSHNRLVELFDKGIIVNPNKIDFLSGRTQDIGSDERVFDTMYQDLNNYRYLGTSHLNNLIDAEHAAMSYDTNLKFSKSEMINIFTGSPIPLKIFKNKLNIDRYNHTFNLARCPTYLTLRVYWKRELSTHSISKVEFLQAAEDVLALVSRGENLQGLIDAEKYKIFEEMRGSERENYLYEKAFNDMIFYEVFFKNNDLFYELGKSFKLGHYQKRGFESLKDQLYYGNLTRNILPKIQKYDELEKIFLTQQHLDEQGSFEEGLHRAQKDIHNNAKAIYRLYFEILNNFDTHRLSKKMQDHYDEILKEPEEPDS